jgi:tRNA U34 5-carboxymethylaminomethyl modifying GTPase MnmE/TrmE
MDTLVKALIQAVECKGQEMVARVRAEERVKTVQAEERVKTAEERVKTVQAEGKLVEAELRKAQTELLFLQGQLHMRGLMGKWLYGMGSFLQ